MPDDIDGNNPDAVPPGPEGGARPVNPAGSSDAGFPAWLALVGGLLFGALGCALVLHFALGWKAPDAEAAAGGPPGGGGGGGPPPASVNTGTVEITPLRERVSLVGRLEEVRRVTVTAEVEGRVVALAVREGDAVVGGETVIASIDRVLADLALRSARANLEAAAAELTQARSNLDQLERLAKASSAKEKEVEDQRTLVAERSARVDQLTSERDRAAVELERCDVVAPFDGAVSRTLVEMGRWVTPGDGVAELVSTGEIDAVVDAPESVVNRLVRGTVSSGDGDGGDGAGDVEVVVDALNGNGDGVGSARLTGRIVSIRPDGFTASRSFPVKVRLSDPDGRLKPGMSVTAHLPVTAEREHITVPRDAVLFGPAGAVVWYARVAGGGGRGYGPEGAADGPPAFMAMSEPVRVLFGVGDRYAVEPLPGAAFPALTAGTTVVTEGAERSLPDPAAEAVGVAPRFKLIEPRCDAEARREPRPPCGDPWGLLPASNFLLRTSNFCPMDLTKFVIQNPVKVAVGVILTVLFGFLSLRAIPIQLTPDVDAPVITIETRWTGRSPEEIEREVIEEQEEFLKSPRRVEGDEGRGPDGQRHDHAGVFDRHRPGRRPRAGGGQAAGGARVSRRGGRAGDRRRRRGREQGDRVVHFRRRRPGPGHAVGLRLRRRPGQADPGGGARGQPHQRAGRARAAGAHPHRSDRRTRPSGG